MTDDAGSRFLESLEPFADFRDVSLSGNYRPLPDGWLIGVADIVDSTGALAAGRYKAVNTVGASVISAIMNLDRNAGFPFAFGGDGASFAVPGGRRDEVSAALAACRTWSGEEMGLSLRAALIPVTEIRSAGQDVRVARFRPSPFVDYAMFDGGGMAWADARMKQGLYEVPPAADGARPDLSGLSCRWKPIAARRGEILSVLMARRPGTAAERFDSVVRALHDLLAGEETGGGSPLVTEGPRYDWPPRGLDLEARASAGGKPRFLRYLPILLEQLVPVVLELLGTRLKRFDPVHYRRVTAQNSDFRKFDDGLKMTVDCSPDTGRKIEDLLAEAHRNGIADYGLHRQDSALMTCIVPSPLTDNHIHFIDGAGGGYAMAAAQLKEMRTRLGPEKL